MKNKKITSYDEYVEVKNEVIELLRRIFGLYSLGRNVRDIDKGELEERIYSLWNELEENTSDDFLKWYTFSQWEEFTKDWKIDLELVNNTEMIKTLYSFKDTTKELLEMKIPREIKFDCETIDYCIDSILKYLVDESPKYNHDNIVNFKYSLKFQHGDMVDEISYYLRQAKKSKQNNTRVWNIPML